VKPARPEARRLRQPREYLCALVDSPEAKTGRVTAPVPGNQGLSPIDDSGRLQSKRLERYERENEGFRRALTEPKPILVR